jgi:hypothetical protein
MVIARGHNLTSKTTVLIFRFLKSYKSGLCQLDSCWKVTPIAPCKKENFIEAFNKMITSEPKRKGKPKLATPEEMKSAWRTVK